MKPGQALSGQLGFDDDPLVEFHRLQLEKQVIPADIKADLVVCRVVYTG